MKRKIEESTTSKKDQSFESCLDVLFFSEPKTKVSSKKALEKPAKTGEIFSTLESVPSFQGNHTRANNKLRGKYTIHTMNTLASLIVEMRKSSNEKTIKLRYVLTPDYELLFAREGRPNSFIPPHFAMTGLDENNARV